MGGGPTFGKNSQIIPYFFSDAFPYMLGKDEFALLSEKLCYISCNAWLRFLQTLKFTINEDSYSWFSLTVSGCPVHPVEGQLMFHHQLTRMPYSSVLLSSSQKIRVCSPSLPMMIITNAGSTNTAHHHWQLSLALSSRPMMNMRTLAE